MTTEGRTTVYAQHNEAERTVKGRQFLPSESTLGLYKRGIASLFTALNIRGVTVLFFM